ncbi:unnamed protein product [Strongylus vulgaris]|uniref:Uncharacterized protein n=1 Tax=Strongylus vulgaris TaxID=40348 RepID=A0A3P7I3S1_STRVU|nr:unnamed protein product [Strongylus vulgaris]
MRSKKRVVNERTSGNLEISPETIFNFRFLLFLLMRALCLHAKLSPSIISQSFACDIVFGLTKPRLAWWNVTFLYIDSCAI